MLQKNTIFNEESEKVFQKIFFWFVVLGIITTSCLFNLAACLNADWHISSTFSSNKSISFISSNFFFKFII